MLQVSDQSGLSGPSSVMLLGKKQEEEYSCNTCVADDLCEAPDCVEVGVEVVLQRPPVDLKQ